MIKYNYLIPLFILIFLLMIFALTIISGKISFNFSEKQKFSFRNRFPFELYHQNKTNVLIAFRSFLILLFAVCLLINALFITTFDGPSNIAYSSVISLFFTFSLLCALVLFILKPNYLKQFKIYSTLLFAFSLMSNCMLGIIMLSSIYDHFSYKILCGVSFFLALVNLIIMLNPKLKKWDRLEQQKNNDGALIYVRPKISPLAFSIWINYLTLILGEATILFSIILNSLGY